MQSESLERARHSRGERMRAQAEQACDLRRRNQQLIHNVLPPHVARHFMGARHHHRDLYSQSYAEVGVLFASMPNFSGIYSRYIQMNINRFTVYMVIISSNTVAFYLFPQ